MILTFIYMVATVMQARTISFLKTRLHNILKQDKCSSIMLCTKSSVVLPKKDCDGYKSKIQGNNGSNYNDGFINFHLCLEHDTARLGDLLWYQEDMKLCTICPKQKLDISQWLAYPYGKLSFPLNVNNRCQILSAPDHKMHMLVEADLETCRPQTSAIATKLEDYGVLTAWTAKYESINFILETDIDRITNFIAAVTYGRYYINNGLLLTRIQTLSISGKPCIYDTERFNESSPDENTMSTMHIQWGTYVQKLKALSDAAEKAFRQNTTVEVAELSGVTVCPQNPDLNTNEKAAEDNTVPEESILEKTAASSSPSKEDVGSVFPVSSTAINVTNAECTPLNTSIPSKKLLTTTEKERTDNSITAQSSDATHASKRKDNILSNKDNKISTKNIDQSKSTEKTVNLKATSTHLSGLKGEEKYGKMIKPPNVLIYADTPDAINNIKTVLEKVLEANRYVVYALSREAARSSAWIDQVALVVICGNIDSDIRAQLVEYIIHGGKLLALCSDMLHTLLPSFKTAEVRESELVHFSYGKWKHVRMMHHIFCYHASPVRARFSQDHEDTRTPSLNPPASTSVKDKRGNLHSFDVKVLGTEETWHNPSILLATMASSGGKVVFSQIHLEVDPMQYEYEEDKFKALKESNITRLEIISDLLSTHLGMEVSHAVKIAEEVKYTAAYFLGTFEKKLQVIQKLKDKIQEDNLLKMPNLVVRFYTSDIAMPSALDSFLPIVTHRCPANFSTVKYYESLTTNNLGRLVIYADILTSSMHVTECHLEHGLAVITRQQTKGQARSRNVWLSPMGCAMFTLQMHIPKNSFIGYRISNLQHYVAVAVVHSVRSKPGYQDIDLRLKWPNDIYVGTSTKIGGLLVHTLTEESQYICNIGVGINLSNSKPTSCINNMIQEYNQAHGTKLRTFSYEEFVADVFNTLELLYDTAQNTNDMGQFHKLYRTYWLHEDSNVMVIKQNGESENVKIMDIDDFGYLLVEGKDHSVFSVHPDGNTFDLLKGLIAPK